MLGPSNAWCWRFDGEHLTSPWLGEHGSGPLPLGRHHEQSPSVGTTERAGEAAAVKVDRIQHLAAFAHTHTTFVGKVRVPDGTLCVEANTVRHAVAEIGPHPPCGQAAVGRDVKGREPPGV